MRKITTTWTSTELHYAGLFNTWNTNESYMCMTVLPFLAPLREQSVVLCCGEVVPNKSQDSSWLKKPSSHWSTIGFTIFSFLYQLTCNEQLRPTHQCQPILQRAALTIANVNWIPGLLSQGDLLGAPWGRHFENGGATVLWMRGRNVREGNKQAYLEWSSKH